MDKRLLSRGKRTPDCMFSLRRISALLAMILPLCTAADVVERPKLLQNGIPQEGLVVSESDLVVYRFVVPAGAKDLNFDTAGGKGDCDLFVRFGVHPSDTKYDKSSTGPTTRENVHFKNPQPGVWYVRLAAASAFSGVKLTAQYSRTPDAEAVPKLLPGPGTYAAFAKVQMKTALAGGIVRYTTDGTDPTPQSPAFLKSLTLAADTEVRAQTFAGATPRGPVLVAPYFISAPAAATPLQNGLAIEHRAGMTGSDALFKITIPDGMKRLHVLTRGGTGDIALIVRKDAPPAAGVFDSKQFGNGTRADLIVKNPAAGDWFIVLRGRSNYSGCTLQAAYRGTKADLIVWPGVLAPYETTETFTDLDCEVQEGMTTAGTHRFLRFSTESRNIGGGDVQLGSPVGNPNFEFAECHGHYHFLGFAGYALKKKDGTLVATGRKVSFCLEDMQQWDSTASPDSKYDCDTQGIQVGWSDIYDSGLAGQWIDITNIPAGDYDLEVTINPAHIIDEADYSNNTARIPVTISGPP